MAEVGSTIYMEQFDRWSLSGQGFKKGFEDNGLIISRPTSGGIANASANGAGDLSTNLGVQSGLYVFSFSAVASDQFRAVVSVQRIGPISENPVIAERNVDLQATDFFFRIRLDIAAGSDLFLMARLVIDLKEMPVGASVRLWDGRLTG